MQNQCPDCKSAVMRYEGICGACGFQMRGLRNAPRGTAPWKYRMAAIVTGLGVAVAHYLIQG